MVANDARTGSTAATVVGERSGTPRGGIEIQRGGRPVEGKALGGGSVYLVVDCSSSMEGSKIEQAQKGALDFTANALARGYAVGLIGFSSDPSLIFTPQTNAMVVRQQLPRMRAGGSTNLAKAIELATDELRGRRVPIAMVVITDGMPDDEGNALAAARKAKEIGIDIITVGTDDADRRFLEKLASRADLSVVVRQSELGSGIGSASKMLPRGRVAPR